MTIIANSLVPVMALILAGFLIRRTGFLPDSFWPSAERLTYYLLYPALLIHNLANKDLGGLPWIELFSAVELTVLVAATLVVMWGIVDKGMGGRVFTSLFQGGVRFNSFVALALAESIYGSDGLLIAAICSGFMIVLINLLCISAFSVAVPNGGFSLKRFIYTLATNPLVMACVIGAAINFSGMKLPSFVDAIFAMTGKAVFPIALMAVGAGIRLGNLGSYLKPFALSSVVQFGIKPFAAFYLATLMGLAANAVAVVVLLFSVPTASSAFILSRQLGGDPDSMAAIITLQTGLSFITLPLVITLIA